MTALRSVAILLLLPVSLFGEDLKPNTLSPKEIEEGWILLFDGESTFGWKASSADEKVKPDVAVKDGALVLTGENTSLELATRFRRFELRCNFSDEESDGGFVTIEDPGAEKGKITENRLLPGTSGRRGEYQFTCDDKFTGSIIKSGSSRGDFSGSTSPNSGPLTIRFSPTKEKKNAKLILRNIKLKPLGTKTLFNGKDLTGWKVFPGERYKSVFSVTKEGWLNVKNGPGDLRTEGSYDDFVLQLECISNGKALNSGVFFRCIAEQYQNGYEMQIQNGFKDNDRTKPADGGTGAIYRRFPARKVIPNDNEWFSMTLVARDKHFATWVNGIQVADWLDERPAHENPRNGSRTAKGHLSIQGHDPTTDLSFRNLRISEFK